MAVRRLPVSLSGSGSGEAVQRFDFDRAPAAGRVIWLTLAHEGGASSLGYKLVHGGQPADGVGYDDIPQRYHSSRSTEAIALVDDPDVTALDTVIEAAPPFADGLALVVDVTAVGAWALTGSVWVDQ